MSQTLLTATAARPTSLLTGRLSLGMMYVLCVPLAAGVGAVREIYVAGVSYTALLWGAFLFGGALLLLGEWALHPDVRSSFPCRPWLLWIGYVWLSLTWVEQAGLSGLQEAAQISTPVLIGVIASRYVRTAADYRLLVRSFVGTLPVMAVLVVATLTGRLSAEQEDGGVYCAVRPLALTAGLTAAVLLAQWQSARLLPVLGWLACLGMAAVTGGRMASAALLLVPLVNPLYRSRLTRWAMGGCLLLAALVLFNLPSVQERFFYSGSGNLTQLSKGEFRDSGRSEIWYVLWERVPEHPVLGAGIGSSGRYLLSRWSNMSHAHNDYVRVLYDLGGLGLAAFLGLLAWQALDLVRGLRQSTGATRSAFTAALLGFFVFSFTAITDNPLVYHLWYMNPLFALTGAAYGLARTTIVEKEAQG
jgi:O-antigen ligase